VPAPSAFVPPSRLERFLRLFTEVRTGEGLTGTVMFANVLLILCAYYFVKPLREGWIAISDLSSWNLSKMEVKAYSSFAQGLLFLSALGIYNRLSRRWPRRRLITAATLFCMSNLVVFWLIHGYLRDYLPSSGIVFYLWVGMFGLFVVAQFWVFAADLYSDEQGRRLFPLIAVGATSGAVVGSYLTELVVQSHVLESGDLLLLATVPLAASIALTWVADRRGPGGEPAQAPPPPEPTAELGSDESRGSFRLIFGQRYLLAVALVTLLTNWVNTNGENLLFDVVQDALEGQIAATGVTSAAQIDEFVRDGTTAFYGNFFFWVNTAALGLQAFVASRLLAAGGFGSIILLLPIISLLSYASMALVPILAVVRFMKIAENATDYSINNTARQVLWLPTSVEMKYRAKPAIDTFFVRGGDGLAAATVLIGVQLLDLTTRGFFAFNISLGLLWLGLAAYVARDHARLVRGEIGDAKR
jgi:ATP:ADP antiporter, AAA family